METLIYIGKISLYWVLFYTIYQLFLRQQTFFQWNRVYLLGSLLLSLVLPLIIYPASAPLLPVMYAVNAPSFTVMTKSSSPSAAFYWVRVLALVYACGVLYTGFIRYTSIRQLTDFLQEGLKVEMENCTLVLVDSNHIGSFSFLKWVVINRNDYENHFEAILSHEMVHVRQAHTLDILLIELLRIIFWFNPILIWHKKALQEVHEYLADEAAPDREKYASFLLSYALNAPVSELTNHFFKRSQLKRRITMIYKNRTSKWLLSTYMIALAMMCMVALVIAGCERTEEREIPIVEEEKTQTVENIDLLDRTQTDDQVFMVVDEQPVFPGGVKAMIEFLGNNIKYPERAVKANVSGRVYLSFVVTQTGEIKDIKVLKGIGFGCDEEAVRVISTFPKWNPGKQSGVPVQVMYNLPINFQREEDAIKIEKENDTNGM